MFRCKQDENIASLIGIHGAWGAGRGYYQHLDQYNLLQLVIDCSLLPTLG